MGISTETDAMYRRGVIATLESLNEIIIETRDDGNIISMDDLISAIKEAIILAEKS